MYLILMIYILVKTLPFVEIRGADVSHSTRPRVNHRALARSHAATSILHANLALLGLLM